ncbi:MAG: hypothetical protein JWM95_4752 [Gemmatimonadetes bacterium]|nr:hypothetical protein [Gemmatimonadota bacterium]
MRRIHVHASAIALAFVSLGAAPSVRRARPAVPTARVTVVKAPESTDQRVVLLVRVEGDGMVLGSYQGRVHFDPAAFVVDSTAAGKDGSRYVNAAEAAKGSIRFAGFTTNGFKSADAVRIVGHATRPLASAKIAAELEVAGDLDGKSVAKTGLIAAAGLTAAK